MAEVKDIYTGGVLRVETCYRCGVPFGLLDSFRTQRIKDRESFFCPNGHSQHYLGETVAKKLRRELDRANISIETLRRSKQNVEDRLETSRRSAAATRGHLSRVKKRVSAGVCPCCNRTFINLGRHMSGQHPGYAGSPEEPKPTRSCGACGKPGHNRRTCPE